MKKIALGLAVSLLVGCATYDSTGVASVQQPQAVYQALEELDYTPLKIYDDNLKQVRQLTPRSAVLKSEGAQSSVLGWKIPSYGVYRFKLSSSINRARFGRDASAFMAEVRLLDKKFNVIKTLPAKSLSYQKPGLMEEEYFYHSFVVDNRDPLLPPTEYIVVVMTEAGRQNQIMVVDQEKEYAKVRGTLPPATADIMATASENGTITLEAVAVTSTPIGSDIPASAYVPPVPNGAKTEVESDVGYDTTGISRAYREQVQNLLQAGDVIKALEMRQSIDSLQIALQKDFASLYKGAGDSPLIDKKVLDTMSLEQRLAAAYKNQLRAYFKLGKTRKALALLDQAKSLKGHVDGLF